MKDQPSNNVGIFATPENATPLAPPPPSNFGSNLGSNMGYTPPPPPESTTGVVPGPPSGPPPSSNTGVMPTVLPLLYQSSNSDGFQAPPTSQNPFLPANLVNSSPFFGSTPPVVNANPSPLNYNTNPTQWTPPPK